MSNLVEKIVTFFRAPENFPPVPASVSADKLNKMDEKIGYSEDYLKLVIEARDAAKELKKLNFTKNDLKQIIKALDIARNWSIMGLK